MTWRRAQKWAKRETINGSGGSPRPSAKKLPTSRSTPIAYFADSSTSSEGQPERRVLWVELVGGHRVLKTPKDKIEHLRHVNIKKVKSLASKVLKIFEDLRETFNDCFGATY